MTASIAEICDSGYPLNVAVERALHASQAAPGFEFELSRFLQTQCMADNVDRSTVFRGLEVLGGLLNENRLVVFLRPFLRSKDSQIASKSVLILGQQSRGLSWVASIRTESDARIRANLVESLWTRKGPEVDQVLRAALRDSHHRVVANAAYGLYLLGSDAWIEGLDQLLTSRTPVCRRSGIWLIKSIDSPASTDRLRALIRDADSHVRRAAFDALASLRESAVRRANGPPVVESPMVELPAPEIPAEESQVEAPIVEAINSSPNS